MLNTLTLLMYQFDCRSYNIRTDNYAMIFKRRFWTRARIIFAGLILCCIVIFNTDLSPDLYFLHWDSLENIDCYWDTTDDILPSAEDVEFAPSAESIFFHETSCRGNLNSRQACAVEAAARAHPDWDVYVLFAGPVRAIEGSLKTLQSFRNVQFARIHLEEYARDTPAEKLVISGALSKTRWRISHTSDVLRYLTLYKWGGVYLDLDTVVVKSFNSLKNNWSARESDLAVAAGAMSFSRDQLGRAVAYIAINNLAANFRGDYWGHNGPGVITRVLKDMCSTSDVQKMTAATCRGFEVYSPALFYPISWQNADEYFIPGELDSPEVYIYHVWNKVTINLEVHENSRYANLAKKYCPSVYENHGEDFGLRRKNVSDM